MHWQDMAVFTFVVRQLGDTWMAKERGGEAGLEASAASTWELERKLTALALSSAGRGAVSSSFSLITPTSAVAQVIVAGGRGGGALFVSSALPASGDASAADTTSEEEMEDSRSYDEYQRFLEESDDEYRLGSVFWEHPRRRTGGNSEDEDDRGKRR